MHLFKYLFVHLPIVIGHIQNLVKIYQPKNYDLLIYYMNEHFNKDFETTLFSTASDYEYLNELIKELHLKHNRSLEIDSRPQNVWRDCYNILLLDLVPGPNEDFYKKKLIYYDYRHYECETLQEKINLTLELLSWNLPFAFFNTLILIENSPNCSVDHTLLVREFWNECKWKRISRVRKAYFNQRPDMRKLSYIFVSNVKLDIENAVDGNNIFQGRAPAFAKYILKSWNYSKFVELTESANYLFFPVFPIQQGFFFEPTFNVLPYCVVIQKSEYIPSWQAVTRSFDVHVWIAIFVMWIVSGICWYFMDFRHTSLYNSFSIMLSLYISQSSNVTFVKKSLILRFLIMFILLGSVIFSNGFQYSHLQSPSRYPPKDKLQQLLDHNYTVRCHEVDFVYEFFKNSSDSKFSILNNIYVKWFPVNDAQKLIDLNVTLDTVYHDATIALILPCQTALTLINQNAKYQESLHIMKDRIGTYPLLLNTLRRGFPFYDKFLSKLSGFVENGLFLWYDELQTWNTMMQTFNQHESEIEKVKIFSINDLIVAFIILLIGLALAMCVFIGEMFFARYKLYIQSKLDRIGSL